MSRPEDIPEDVWEAACAVERALPGPVRGGIGDLSNEVVARPIARAILAERERCLTVAQSLRGPSAELIADQIVSGIVKERLP